MIIIRKESGRELVWAEISILRVSSPEGWPTAPGRSWNKCEQRPHTGRLVEEGSRLGWGRRRRRSQEREYTHTLPVHTPTSEAGLVLLDPSSCSPRPSPLSSYPPDAPLSPFWWPHSHLRARWVGYVCRLLPGFLEIPRMQCSQRPAKPPPERHHTFSRL